MTWYTNSEGRYGINGAKGDRGEAIVEEYCKTNNLDFVDKNDYNSQVKEKIDCIINNVKIDVKTNYFKGFLAVELHVKKKNKPGWIYTTGAEEIYGVDEQTKSIYRYNVKAMLDYVEKNQHRAKITKKGDKVLWVSVDKNNFIEKIQ